jgi:chemotaxis regulatin CheY-phosphate phosphatase CheZ
MKIEQIFKVISHDTSENDSETEIEMDQDFLDVDGTIVRVVIPSDESQFFPVNSRVKVTLERVI